MTADEVLEAMARGMYESAGMRTPWAKASRRAKAIWFIYARAAIRAVTERGGLVVAKVPEDAVCTEGASEIEWAWVSGANHAYAAVRASAVEVE